MALAAVAMVEVMSFSLGRANNNKLCSHKIKLKKKKNEFGRFVWSRVAVPSAMIITIIIMYHDDRAVIFGLSATHHTKKKHFYIYNTQK